jgi:hypothetical protein
MTKLYSFNILCKFIMQLKTFRSSSLRVRSLECPRAAGLANCFPHGSVVGVGKKQFFNLVDKNEVRVNPRK